MFHYHLIIYYSSSKNLPSTRTELPKRSALCQQKLPLVFRPEVPEDGDGLRKDTSLCLPQWGHVDHVDHVHPFFPPRCFENPGRSQSMVLNDHFAINPVSDHDRISRTYMSVSSDAELG